MKVKLLILLIFTGTISVNTRKIIEPVEKSNKNENMYYGWQARFLGYDNSLENSCFGMFFGDGFFISDAWCILRYTLGRDDQKIFIQKPYHDYWNNSNAISVNMTNIYFHEILSRKYDLQKRQIAVLVADEVVDSKFGRDGYIKLNENLDDVNTSRCFIPSFDSWNVTYMSCEVVYFENDNPHHIYCLSRDIPVSSGNTFICHLKKQPDVKVLVGILSEILAISGNCGNSGFKLLAIENVSGLGSIISEKIKKLI